MAVELSLFPETLVDTKNTSTFEDNMKLPIHSWYRYTAGFSAAWVGQLIEEEKLNGRTHILDPFVGSGTVVLESVFHGVDAYGLESNPYVNRIAQAKLYWRFADNVRLCDLAREVLQKAKRMPKVDLEYPSLIRRCYEDDSLQKLDALKRACNTIENDGDRNFVWFIITSILRSASPVGTAQWQYIQPNKTKSNVLDPFVAYHKKVEQIFDDIYKCCNYDKHGKALILKEDARKEYSIPKGWCDMVITSPPYANNYDYADAMRLEMLFWGDIEGWKDMTKISDNLVRACTQHVARLKSDASKMMENPVLSPIREELAEKYHLLETERENHGGKKNYHLMVLAYFYDLAHVFLRLNRVASENCKMCFVIGDSAPYGIYIPVDEWLGRLAVSAGFSDYTFEKLRDRNIKWKNRKHRVPLKEGRLWINK